MTDRRLQVFHAVARHRSFTRAAEALLMTQPAVTFQVRQLESEYKIRLLERQRNAIALTPAGEMVLHYAEKILGLSSELDTRLAELTGEVRGTLQIGASSSLSPGLLPVLLADFNALYPQVLLRLTLGNSAQIAAQVAAHQLDLGLTASMQVPHGAVSERCAEEALQIVCAPDYPLAELARVSAADLTDYEFLAREPGSGVREATDHWFRQAGTDPERLKTLMEIGSPETLRALLLQGLGFAILPQSEIATLLQAPAVRQSGKPPLCCIPASTAGNAATVPRRLARPLCLLHPKDQFQSHLVSTFNRFARQKLAEIVA